jgi:hypothetical protein
LCTAIEFRVWTSLLLHLGVLRTTAICQQKRKAMRTDDSEQAILT